MPEAFHFLRPIRILHDIQEAGLSALLSTVCSGSAVQHRPERHRVALANLSPFVHRGPKVTAVVFIHISWFSTRPCADPLSRKSHHFNRSMFSLHPRLQKIQVLIRPLSSTDAAVASSYRQITPAVIFEETARWHLSTPASQVQCF